MLSKYTSSEFSKKNCNFATAIFICLCLLGLFFHGSNADCEHCDDEILSNCVDSISLMQGNYALDFSGVSNFIFPGLSASVKITIDESVAYEKLKNPEDDWRFIFTFSNATSTVVVEIDAGIGVVYYKTFNISTLNYVRDESVTLDSTWSVSCVKSTKVECGLISITSDLSNVTCYNNGGVANHTYNHEDCAIEFSKSTFHESPGVYECFGYQNGKQVLLDTFRACISSIPVHIASIKPESNVIEAHTGKQLNVSCFGSIGGTDDGANVFVQWERKNETNQFEPLCTTGDEDTEKYLCKLNVRTDAVCNASEPEGGPPNFNSVLTISDVSKHDFGTYKCSVSNNVKFTEGEFDIKEIPQKPPLAAILSITLGLALLIVVLVIVIKIFLYDIKYLIKKQQTPLDSKGRYAAYFLYYFNKNSMSEKDIISTTTQVNKLKRSLKSCKITYFDRHEPQDHHPPQNEIGAEILPNDLEQCWTVIVFVTKAMVDKDMASLVQILAQEKISAKEKKVIFVCESGAKKKLCEIRDEPYSQDRAAAITILSSMKLSKNVVLSARHNDWNSSKFSKKLYVELPKLTRR